MIEHFKKFDDGSKSLLPLSFSHLNEFAFYRIHNRSMSVDFKLMKQGFLQAAKILQAFFKDEGDYELYRLSKEKYNEIYKKGKVSFFKQVKSKVYSKLAFCYRYVRKN